MTKKRLQEKYTAKKGNMGNENPNEQVEANLLEGKNRYASAGTTLQDILHDLDNIAAGLQSSWLGPACQDYQDKHGKLTTTVQSASDVLQKGSTSIGKMYDSYLEADEKQKVDKEIHETLEMFMGVFMIVTSLLGLIGPILEAADLLFGIEIEALDIAVDVGEVATDVAEDVAIEEVETLSSLDTAGSIDPLNEEIPDPVDNPPEAPPQDAPVDTPLTEDTPPNVDQPSEEPTPESSKHDSGIELSQDEQKDLGKLGESTVSEPPKEIAPQEPVQVYTVHTDVPDSPLTSPYYPSEASPLNSPEASPLTSPNYSPEPSPPSSASSPESASTSDSGYEPSSSDSSTSSGTPTTHGSPTSSGSPSEPGTPSSQATESSASSPESASTSDSSYEPSSSDSSTSSGTPTTSGTPTSSGSPSEPGTPSSQATESSADFTSSATYNSSTNSTSSASTHSEGSGSSMLDTPTHSPTPELSPDSGNPSSTPGPITPPDSESAIASDSSLGSTPSSDGSLASVYKQAQAIDKALGRGGSESPSTATESSTGPATSTKRPLPDNSSPEAGPSTKKGKQKA